MIATGLCRCPDNHRAIGVDMTRLQTPAHLVSWARFTPGISQSAGRQKGNSSTGHGNNNPARPRCRAEQTRHPPEMSPAVVTLFLD